VYYIPLIVTGFFIFFTVLWCAVLAILSLAGDGTGFQKNFLRLNFSFFRKEFRFQSARFRVVNYSLCVTVRIHEEGIVISVMKHLQFQA
jgi:hypothetical protein